MSMADLDGRFQIKERETTAITKDSEGQRTRTTIYLPNTTGEFVPNMQVNEQQKRIPNGTIETKKETLFPDLSTTTDIKTQGSSGPEETITVTARYPAGYPSVVSVERRKSEGEH
jgi:hypothetical protein